MTLFRRLFGRPRRRTVAAAVAAYVVLGVAAAVLAAWYAQSSPTPTAREEAVRGSVLTPSPTGVAVLPTPSGTFPATPAAPATPVATLPITTQPRPVSSTTPVAAPPTIAPTRRPTATRTQPRVPVQPRSVDLALGRPVSVSSSTDVYFGSNITDGDAATYWESASAFPQTVRVDLGSVTTVGRLVLELPPASDWNRRGQVVEIAGSRDGSSFVTLKAARKYVFDANAASHDTVTVSVPPGGRRWLELRFLGNDGWGAAQLGELRVHSS